MRSLSEAGVKILSKIPKIPIETEWLTEQVEKWAMGCNNGYAKLQSGRISRGRLTMQDTSDERATNAWSERVWQKGGTEKWPEVLRPQRPEQFTLNTRLRQSQIRANRRQQKSKLPVNPDVDIFDNPPVFLKIKDIKKQKQDNVVAEERLDVSSQPSSRAGTPRRHRSPRKHEVVGGGSKVSPMWPAALLTYEKGVSPVNSPHRIAQL